LISLHDPRPLVAVVSPLGSGWLEDDLLKSERLNFSSGTEVQITVAEGHRRHPRARVRTEESHRIGALNFRGSTFQAFDPNSSRGTSDDRHRSIGSQGLPAARGSITGALIEPISAPQLNGKAHAVCHSKLSAKIVSGEITQSGELNPLKVRPKAL
jgi:hypothetical protein